MSDTVDAVPTLFDSGAPLASSGIDHGISHARQAMSNWCWAACAQMLAKRNGLEISQGAIVALALGRQECALADPPMECNTMLSASQGLIALLGQLNLNVEHEFSAPSANKLKTRLASGPVEAILAPGGSDGVAHVVLVHYCGQLYAPACSTVVRNCDGNHTGAKQDPRDASVGCHVLPASSDMPRSTWIVPSHGVTSLPPFSR